MRVAALDLGTNTFLCLILESAANGGFTILRDESRVVRLGQGVDRTGRFHPDALLRAEACLEEFKQIMDELKVDRILGAATSAARDVENGDELFAIARKLKIPLEIIAGEEEARLSYRGACFDFDDERARLVVDIGGGSTELILGKSGKLLFAESFDLGGVRLTEKFVSTQPVPVSDQERLSLAVSSILAAPLETLRNFEIDEIIAVAGTPTALAAIELGGFEAQKVNGFQLSVARLKSWRDVFSQTTVEEKRDRFGLGGRADIIFAGVSILLHLVEGLQKKSVTVSVRGLRYGVALELLARP